MLLTAAHPCRNEKEWLAALPAIRSAHYGVIETRGGRLESITLRRFPTLVALPELWPTSNRYHVRGTADCCRLYYNEPRSCPGYLTLKYIVSTQATQYATFRAAIAVLDAIAREKKIDAIVCDAANSRLSDRFMQRQGWEKHMPRRWHRNFIKRFYGQYPQLTLPLAERC